MGGQEVCVLSFCRVAASYGAYFSLAALFWILVLSGFSWDSVLRDSTVMLADFSCMPAGRRKIVTTQNQGLSFVRQRTCAAVFPSNWGRKTQWTSAAKVKDMSQESGKWAAGKEAWIATEWKKAHMYTCIPFATHTKTEKMNLASQFLTKIFRHKCCSPHGHWTRTICWKRPSMLFNSKHPNFKTKKKWIGPLFAANLFLFLIPGRLRRGVPNSVNPRFQPFGSVGLNHKNYKCHFQDSRSRNENYDSPSSQGAQEALGSSSDADFLMVSGRGSECRTIAPYKPYSAIMEHFPQVFSVFLHLARRFWNQTWRGNVESLRTDLYTTENAHADAQS